MTEEEAKSRATNLEHWDDDISEWVIESNDVKEVIAEIYKDFQDIIEGLGMTIDILESP